MNKEKLKSYFDVKVETMLPATITYRVFAESPENAIEMIKFSQPNSVKYKLAGKKDLKLTVYDAGSCLIKFVKKILR